MSRRALLLSAWLLAAFGLATASRASEQSLSLNAGLGSVHNDNFLEYSDNQLRTFADGTHPLRFAIESTDDAIFSPGVSLTWQLDQGGGHRHALRAHWDGDFHARNPGADRRSWNARWTETLPGGRRLALGYGRMGHYYVRQLRDEDLPASAGDARWQRAEFDQDAFSFSWREPLGGWGNVALAYRREQRDYVPAFRERSSTANEGELSLAWDQLPRDGRLECSAGYRALAADGNDGDGIAGDDEDVSYRGFLAGVTGRMRFARTGHWRFGGDLGVDLATREYTSDRPLAVDPFHAGRNDVLAGLEAGVRASWRRWDARAFFRVENNTAHLGTGAPPTSDSGSYHEDQVGLSLSWSGEVWKTAR